MYTACTPRSPQLVPEGCASALLESSELLNADYTTHLSRSELNRCEQMSSNRKLGWLAARLAAKYLFLSQFQMDPSVLRREGHIVKLTGERLRRHSPWMYRHVEVLPPEKALELRLQMSDVLPGDF